MAPYTHALLPELEHNTETMLYGDGEGRATLKMQQSSPHSCCCGCKTLCTKMVARRLFRRHCALALTRITPFALPFQLYDAVEMCYCTFLVSCSIRGVLSMEPGPWAVVVTCPFMAVPGLIILWALPGWEYVGCDSRLPSVRVRRPGSTWFILFGRVPFIFIALVEDLLTKGW